MASLWVATSVSGLRVCPRQAATVLTSLCIDVQANGKWNQYRIPFVLGGTSNGISLNSNGSNVSGNIYVDDGFVGKQAVTQVVDEAKLIGEAYYPTTASCIWTRTTTSTGDFPTTSACPGPTISFSSLGSWQTTDADLPQVTINSLPAGDYEVEVFANVAQTGTAGVGWLRVSDGTTNGLTYSGYFNDSQVSFKARFKYSEARNRTFKVQAGHIGGSTTGQSITNNSSERSLKFRVYRYGSDTIYSAQNKNVDWSDCSFSSLAWQGLGTVSSVGLQCKREGGDLLMRGRFTVGTVTASTVQVPLPQWNGAALTTASSTVIPAIAPFGRLLRSTSTSSAARDFAVLVSSGQSNFNIGAIAEATTTNPFTALAGSSAFGSSETVALENVRIPIAGWENSNQIIGSFKETPTTRGSSGVDIQSVYFGSGTNCATACTTGTCTICRKTGDRITSVTWQSTGVYNINGIDGTKYNCFGGAYGTATGDNLSYVQNLASSTTSLAQVFSLIGSTAKNGYGSIICIGVP